jgi:hypothetical protein
MLLFFLIYMFLIIFFYVESMPVMLLWSLSSSEYREAMLSSLARQTEFHKSFRPILHNYLRIL